MRINHNIAALNTFRQLGQANNAQSNSMEKLSSGFVSTMLLMMQQVLRFLRKCVDKFVDLDQASTKCSGWYFYDSDG